MERDIQDEVFLEYIFLFWSPKIVFSKSGPKAEVSPGGASVSLGMAPGEHQLQSSILCGYWFHPTLSIGVDLSISIPVICI